MQDFSFLFFTVLQRRMFANSGKGICVVANTGWLKIQVNIKRLLFVFSYTVYRHSDLKFCYLVIKLFYWNFSPLCPSMTPIWFYFRVSPPKKKYPSPYGFQPYSWKPGPEMGVVEGKRWGALYKSMFFYWFSYSLYILLK